jgi:hypothetical protein
VKGGGKGRRQKLAINRLRAQLVRLMAEERPVEETVDRFFAQHEFPIVEQNRCTFAVRTEADAVFLRHRVVGLPRPTRGGSSPSCYLSWTAGSLWSTSRTDGA